MIENFKNLLPVQRKYLVYILSSAFIIKILLSVFFNQELRSDSLDYFNLAKSIVETGEYRLNGQPTAYVVIGYPLFLSIVFKIFGFSIFTVKIIQSLIEIFTCCFFFMISLKYLKPKYALISLAIFSFLPSNIMYSQTVLTEPLFGFFSMLILLYFVIGKITGNIFFIGMLLGASVLIRSSFALSVLLILFFLIVKRGELFEGYKMNRFKRAVYFSVLFLVGFIIVISPWLIRNKIIMNSFTLATQGGFTFWSGSNPDATGTWYHKIEESNPQFNNPDEIAKDREFYKQGIDYALHNPHKYFFTGIKKIGYLFSSERLILLYFKSQSGNDKTSTEVYKSINPVFIALVNIPYFLIMILGTWGILMFKKKTFFIYGFILIWLITFFIYIALSRYHYVLIPFFVLGTANLMASNKFDLKKLSKYKIIIALTFNLFLLVVWFTEFYLLYK